jgi:hypothetical protein
MEELNPLQIEHAEKAEQVATEIIDDIVESGAGILYDHYLDGKTVPHTVENTLGMFSTFLEMKY